MTGALSLNHNIMAETNSDKNKENEAAAETPAAAPKEQYIILYRTNKKGAWAMLPMLLASPDSAKGKLKSSVRAVQAKALKVNIGDQKASFETIKL